MKFLLGTVYVHPICFGIRDFSFACLEVFLNSLAFFGLLLFKKGVANFHVFVNSPVFTLLLISSFIPLWIEKTLGWINLLRFVKIYFVVKHVKICVPPEICILLVLGGMFLCISFRSIWSILFFQVIHCFIISIYNLK